MFGPNSILDIGRRALYASQSALHVTGENISNVNTEGYSRRTVRLEDGFGIDYRPGQMGTGVTAREVVRHFNKFIEDAYLPQATMQSRWDNLATNLGAVESLFNESQGKGISDSISAFFNAWNDLSQRPEDYGSRRELLNSTTTMVSTLNQAYTDLTVMQKNADSMILQEIEHANDLIEKIAGVNKQINVHQEDGHNNPNSLYDARNRYIRELNNIIDLKVTDKGGGDITVTTQSGQTLVEFDQTFSLELGAPRTFSTLTAPSNFEGSIYYEGSDNYEYTIDVTRGGIVSNADGPSVAQYRVSLDGGRTWLKDENGDEKQFYARPSNQRTSVEDLKIWFGALNDSEGLPVNQLETGDEFTIIPQKNLYWVQNTSHKENITPQVYFDGEDNQDRLTGGTLSALFNFRDQYLGKYKDKLDTFATGMAWEVNRRHSQGVGLEKLTYVEGTYSVDHNDRALGSDSTGLTFGSKLQSGSSMVYIYNANTGLVMSGASGALDWNAGLAGIQNFDPDVNSLNSAAAAYNNTFGSYLTASVVNNKLRIQAKDGYNFAFGTDTTGLNAALGINTFFEGDSAGNLGINSKVYSDIDNICAGHVNGGGEANPGDNTVALSLSQLQDTDVNLRTPQEGTTNQTLLEYYNSLVGNVGADANSVKYSQEYVTALAKDLNDRQQEISGVNLDEEMAALIKYQHSYTAAAKLISTADQMLQTVLSLKA